VPTNALKRMLKNLVYETRQQLRHSEGTRPVGANVYGCSVFKLCGTHTTLRPGPTASGCELTGQVCQRLTPSTDQEYIPDDPAKTLTSIIVAKRLHFNVDRKAVNTAARFQDRDSVPFPRAHEPEVACTKTIYTASAGNPLALEPGPASCGDP
jgi:hypothetical protein